MSLRELAEKLKTKKKRGRNLTSDESKRIRSYGHNAERDLVKRLREYGFKAVRVPVSAPSSEPLPDVFATKGDCIYAFEVKATSMDKVYFKQEQVEKLYNFLGMFEVYEKKAAILAGKFPYRWIFKNIDELRDYIIRSDEKSTMVIG